jgi:IclR family transcriptional regulator, pca regulon regulatory protein
MPRTSSAAAKTADDGQEPAWSIPSLREPRYSQSLERGLAILGCFTPSRPVLGIADIADDLGMSRSTTHRYVITLVALGYLEQGASRKYRLGLRVTDLGMSALNSTGLREHAHPYLEELRQRTSYTTNLGVLDGTDVLYVDRVRSFRRGQSAIDLDLHPGSRLPAYSTAMGKLLLANLPEPQQRELIAQIKLTKSGPNTISSKKALREELDEVAAAGFAVDDEELVADLYAIAAPVRNEAREVVAAVNLAAHSSMISLEEMVDALGPHLVSTADRISARLGYRRDDEQK